MTSITLPFWIFALSFGIPCFIFICLVGFLLRKIRHPKKNQFANISLQQLGNSQFHSDLLCSQIDTIFSGLNVILESERLKIQALLSHGNINLFHKSHAARSSELRNTNDRIILDIRRSCSCSAIPYSIHNNSLHHKWKPRALRI